MGDAEDDVNRIGEIDGIGVMELENDGRHDAERGEMDGVCVAVSDTLGV